MTVRCKVLKRSYGEMYKALGEHHNMGTHLEHFIKGVKDFRESLRCLSKQVRGFEGSENFLEISF